MTTLDSGEGYLGTGETDNFWCLYPALPECLTLSTMACVSVVEITSCLKESERTELGKPPLQLTSSDLDFLFARKQTLIFKRYWT